MLLNFIRRRVVATFLSSLMLSGIGAALPAAAGHRTTSLASQALAAISGSKTYDAPAAGRIEVAFSPDAGAEGLVVKAIDSARVSAKGMGYGFTSPAVAAALVRAQHRGVAVQAVVDFKANVTEDRSGKSRAALSSLVNASGQVRTIDVYAIAHDKVWIIDGKTVLTGSFNFTTSAQTRNSENVLVNWDNPALAAIYTQHFERNWAQGKPYVTRY